MAQLDDIIGKENINQFVDLDAKINKVTDSYMALFKIVKETKAEITTNTDSFTKLKAVQEQTATATKKLSEAEKETAKIEKDQAAALSSLEKQRQAAYNAMAKQEAKEKELAAALNMEVKSIEDARKQNEALHKARNGVNLQTAEGKKKAEEYNKTIDKNTEFIRKNADATTKQKMNIGNYKSALEGMPGALGKVGGSMSALDRVMKVIAATNPFTLILVAVTALISILSKLWSSTDSGGTKMKALWEGFKAIFDVLVKRAADFVGGMVKIFSGDFRAGAEQMATAFEGIGAQMAQAAKAAHDYEMEMDKINDLHRSFISDEAKLRREIAELEFMANDQSKTMAEREAALLSVFDKEKKIVEFRKTEAVNSYNLLIDKVAAASGFGREFIKTLIEQDATITEGSRENSAAVAEFYDLYEGEIETLENAFATTQKAEQDFFEQNKRNISKLTGFQEKARKEREDDAKIQAEIDRSAADRKLTITEMTALGTQQIELDIHAETLALKEQMDTDFFSKELDRLEQENEQKLAISMASAQALQEIGNMAFEAASQNIQAEMDKNEKAKEYELQLAGDNKAQIASINEKYAEKERQLKIKSAKQSKAQALFNAIIGTAMATVNGFMSVPFLPVGLAMGILAGVLGSIQIGLIAAQQIPQFFQGTKDAPGGLISVGEKGRELIQTRSGQTLMANRRTVLGGMKGATIYSNRETEEIMKLRNVGYDSKELRQTLTENNDKLIRTIRNKKEVYITPPRGSRINAREGNYFTNYLNKFGG